MEVRAALDAVEEVKRTAGQSSDRREVPLWVSATLCVLAGVSMALLKLEYTWGVLAMVPMIALCIWAAARHNGRRGVRPALKQDIKADPPVSWRAIIPILLLPLANLAPYGSLPWAVLAGVLTAALFAICLHWEFTANAA
ncbi:hypothetical protein C3E79_08735 [Corynebacterium liangguodongii]|uniref:Uncharacterized protein n=2 Tax=Corynebacterium liangguodongii TaxID=2079535 RepID=A0A2S0WFM2_9CORY|nr:hypothetical protein C3E79_08735 [Corynebacterium liangguodongii]PWB98857.1 hypothetical protein DF219_09650 [Corynebacterium liangguodongii]